MPTIGELLIDIKASTASIETSMTKLQGTMATSSASIAGSLRKIVDVMIIDLGSRAVIGLTNLVERTIDAGDKIGRLAASTGLSTTAMSGFGYAAKMADIEVETFATSMERLSFRLLAAEKGNRTLNAEFQRFGIDPAKIKAPEDALLTLSDAFAKMPPSVERTALAMEFFGRGGANMLPLLVQGSASMRALTEEARKLGIQLDPETVSKFEAGHEAMKRLDAMIQGLKFQFVAGMAPALTAYINQLVNSEQQTQALSRAAQQGVTAMRILATAVVALYGAARFLADGLTEAALAASLLFIPIKEIPDRVKQIVAMDKIWEEDTKGTIGTIQNIWTNFYNDVGKGLPKITLTGLPEQDLPKKESEVDKIIKKLDEEVKTYGMIGTEINLVKAISAGATVAELDHITQQIARLNDLKAIYDEMAKRSKAGVAPYGPLSAADLNELLGITQQMIPATAELDMAAEEARVKMVGFYRDSRSWEEKWWIETNDIVELWKQFPELGDMAAHAIEHQNAGWDEHTKQIKKASDDTRLLVTVQRDISQSFADAIFGADSFGDAMQRLLLRIAETIFQVKVLDPLLKKLFAEKEAGTAGGGGGGIFGMLGGFFGGLLGLQGGGSFAAGQPFIAGEAGPEIIYPGVSGMVIPNRGFGGNTYNIDARGADPTVEFRIRRALRESEQRSVARSVSTTREIGLRNIT